jgi:hypothetical protein
MSTTASAFRDGAPIAVVRVHAATRAKPWA